MVLPGKIRREGYLYCLDLNCCLAVVLKYFPKFLEGKEIKVTSLYSLRKPCIINFCCLIKKHKAETRFPVSSNLAYGLL